MAPEELVKIKELKGTLINSQFWNRKGQTLIKITLDDFGRVYHNWYLLTDDKIVELHEYYDRNIIKRFKQYNTNKEK